MDMSGKAGWSRRGFLAAAGAAAWTLSSAQEKSPMGRTTYWMHGFGGTDPKATATALRAAGFDIVVAGGGAAIAAVRDAGMKTWLCGGAFGLGAHKDDDSFKAVDITGKAQVWFSSGSPNHPVLREENLEAYRKMAATEGIEGILVDGCRFASPASGIGPFFTDFSTHSEKKAAALGFDFDVLRRDVRALYDDVVGKGAGEPRGLTWLTCPVGVVEWLTEHPGVLEWLRFRRVCSTEHFRNISALMKEAKLRMGVYIFTPSLAPLVGQSYVDLAPFVDVFAPMIYRNYPDRPGPACLNWELTIFPEELGLENMPEEATAMEMILQLTGLADIVKDRSISGVRAALPPEATGHETAKARAQIGADKELAPIIYIDDPEMARTAESVRRNGADGVNFFVFKETWADMVRPAFPS